MAWTSSLLQLLNGVAADGVWLTSFGEILCCNINGKKIRRARSEQAIYKMTQVTWPCPSGY